VSASDAAETFNCLEYKGSNDWKLDGSTVRTDSPSGVTVSDSEAVETAKRLRREAYVNERITFLKSLDPGKTAVHA
jgi:hypothetical protein